jgi:autotransporter-associated beta strand protein
VGGATGVLGVSTLTNNGTLIFNRSNATDYSGIISGTGAVTKLGAGTVTLSGSNTYSGGTTVSAGSVVGTTSSLQGAITNNASVTFDQATAGTYAGVISGSGSFTKLGAGSVTLSGANTYSGATTVSAGTLLVNGSLAHSAVTVGNGGTLGGSGTLGAPVTVQSGGVLSPGNSPGALAAAALDLQAGSTTFMQVIGSGATAGVAGTDYDQVQITTSGGLTYGGSLNLNFGNSSPFLNGTFFDLFAFTGTPIGHFTSVVSTGTGLYANSSFSRTGGIWTTTIGDQLLSFSELTGRLSFAIAAVPEIDPATGGSALSIVAGVLAMIEQRRRRATIVA